MKYPLGIQDFAQLREGGYVYVDKTRHLYEAIARDGGSYFLSRPRRFGKSLLVATLNELYSGRRDLFEGLWIEGHWDWTRRHPVIWLKFASSGFHNLGLEPSIARMIREIATQHETTLTATTADLAFKELVQQLHARGSKPVILVDEYDKPIIEYIDDPERMDANRRVLKAFYGVLKDVTPLVETVFITGVSAFSQVSIFSDLNHLTHLTLQRNAAAVVGITQAELEDVFAEALEEVDRERVREWYNGYSWDGETRVYNPWSLLNFLRERQYRNYWFSTGTPTFLVKLMRERGIYEPQQLYGYEAELLSFDVLRLDPTAILFQAGYLTMATPIGDDGIIELAYPNREVKQSLDMFLLAEYSSYPAAGSRALRLHRHFATGDIEGAFGIVNALLAEVPYDHWAGQNEHFFHALFFLTFRIAGVMARSEVHTARGRCDVVLEAGDYVYGIEFKLDGSEHEALKQIRERGYLDAYADDARRVVAIGANVSREAKAVVAWAVDGDV